jgi:hypothetical protein
MTARHPGHDSQVVKCFRCLGTPAAESIDAFGLSRFGKISKFGTHANFGRKGVFCNFRYAMRPLIMNS